MFFIVNFASEIVEIEVKWFKNFASANTVKSCYTDEKMFASTHAFFSGVFSQVEESLQKEMEKALEEKNKELEKELQEQKKKLEQVCF